MELKVSMNRKKIKKLKLYTIVFVVISILSFSIAIYQLIHLGTSQNVSFMYNYIAGILPAYFVSYFIVDGGSYLQYYRNRISGKNTKGNFRYVDTSKLFTSFLLFIFLLLSTCNFTYNCTTFVIGIYIEYRSSNNHVKCS